MRNSLSLIFWFLFYPNSAISERSNRHIISDTSIGKIRGRVENIAGSDIDLFLGIPYAKPPVGELRFEKPKPLDDNASREIDALAHPKAENPPAHQPILVLICVGGFQTGSMRRYTKNVTEIVLKYVRKGIIVVAIQFRIGFLGFASTGDSEMPGNFAYWDMTEALRWIRKNADKFDGDPDRITLLGYSSAGSSIATLGLSPHSSCTNINYIADQPYPVPVSCEIEPQLEPQHSGHISASFFGPTRPDYNYILIGPRIDGDFIPTNFLKLMKTAKPKKTILGITEMEPLGFTLLLGNNSLRQLAIPKSEFSSFDKEQLKSYMLQKAIKREYFDGQANEIANDVVEFYTSGNATIKDNWFYLEKAVQFLNDIQFVAPTVWEVQAKLAKQWPMFLYINKYINKRRFPDDFKIRKNFHDNDHMYVLRNPYSTFEYDASDIIMEEFMEQFFANFILKGDPSIPGVAEWPMSNSTHPLQHMVIDLPRPKTEFQFDGLDGVHFWENILKKYSQYDLIMGVAAEKSPSVENWSNVPIMELIVSQRWLFSLANKNISSKEGDVCDPESALWKATAIPHRFLSCHGVDRVYIANDCRVIYGKQKLFDEETQQCVFPPDVTLHSNKRFVTSTGNIHEVSHLDPNFMTSAEESRMKYFDESGIEDEIENIQLNFGTPSNFKPFVKFDKPQVENRLWKINTPSRKPFAIGEKDLTENNNESLNESRISQTVNVGNQPLLSKPRIVKVPLNRVNGSWKYANTCPERRRPMLYLGKDIPVICSRSSMERDSRNAAIILDDCNHADYRCTFSSDRDEYGICCHRLSYLQIRCTLQSRPLLLEVDRQNENFGNPACIFDMGDYHCCEYIEDHNHPLNSTQNGETYYETSVVINTKGVLRRSDDSSVTKDVRLGKNLFGCPLETILFSTVTKHFLINVHQDFLAINREICVDRKQDAVA
ncbi:carboxylesterase family domain-containing protein [Ditylenchus destructor]|nr:carboxylesterase family domain-containing protein [Ditylenchus destructor]